MYSSNSHKFLAIVIFASILPASCSFFKDSSTTKKVQTSESEVQTNIPFPNIEPDIFQAKIVTSTFLNGEKSTRANFIAKNNEKEILTFSLETENEISYLKTSEKQSFLIKHKDKTYQEMSFDSDNYSKNANSSWQSFLTTNWLNEKKAVAIEKLETEEDLTKYRVELEGSENSEVLIYLNKNIPFPTKQEFYSLANNKRKLNYSIEIKDFNTIIDEEIFEIPNGYTEIN